MDFDENEIDVDDLIEQQEQEENEQLLEQDDRENWFQAFLERFTSLPSLNEIDNHPNWKFLDDKIGSLKFTEEPPYEERNMFFEKLLVLEKIAEEDKERRKLEFEKREQEKKDIEEQLKTAQTTPLTSTEIKQAQDKAIETEKLYFISKFVHEAGKVSFHNDVAAKLAAHWVLSPLLKNIKLYKGDGVSYIDARLHVLHLQESQTGKNMLTRWASSLLAQLPIEENPGTLEQQKYIVEKIGNATSASLLNRKIAVKGKITDEDRNACEKPMEYYIGKYKFYDGAIQYADLLYFEEAAPIFMSRGSEYTSAIPEILISCMEPLGTESNVYRKKLKESDMRTIGNASLYLSTRPIELKYYEAISGMTQRMLFYPRHVDEKLSLDMMNDAIMNLFGDEETNKKAETKNKELIDELKRIQTFLRTIHNNIQIKKEEKKDILMYLIKRNTETVDAANKYFIKSKKKQDLAHTLLRSDINLSYKLACHSAVVRFSRYIERQDIEYAVSLINQLLEAQIQFIDENIKEEVRDEIAKQDIKKYVRMMLSQPKAKLTGIPRLIIRKALEKEYDLSKGTANNFINRYSSEDGFMKMDADGICKLNDD